MAPVATGDVTHKDVMIALTGASAALAGVVLVFLGLLVTGYQGYAGDTTSDVTEPIRRAAWSLFGVFVLGLVAAALCGLWLVIPGGHCLYWFSIGLFAADLLAIVVSAGYAVRKLLA